MVQRSVNWTYRFPAAGVVLRLAVDSPETDRLVQVAVELERLAVPAVRLAPEITQPVRLGGWAATVWRLLPAAPAGRHPAADLAVPLRLLHASRPTLSLPAWDLLGSIRAMLHSAAVRRSLLDDWTRYHLQQDAAELLARLHQHADYLACELAEARWTLPTSTVHGDAHTGNLLHTSDGRPVLCDLDSISIGPAEADLVPAAHALSRLGADPADYARMVRRYGYDVRDSPGWPTLRRLRDLQLATYRLPDPPGEPAAKELTHRLNTVLTGNSATQWHRFPS